LDRNLGAYVLKAQLSAEGFRVEAHDDLFGQTERDPWIFYWAGKNDRVMVTADLDFKNLFPHQAGIALGSTAVFSFTGKAFDSGTRGNAFIKGRAKILRMLKNQPRPFIATIRSNGEIHLDTANPTPSRRKIDPRDWESYERVCKAEGIDPEAGRALTGPADLRGNEGRPEDQADAEAAKANCDEDQTKE
jgi:hypothetical protein